MLVAVVAVLTPVVRPVRVAVVVAAPAARANPAVPRTELHQLVAVEVAVDTQIKVTTPVVQVELVSCCCRSIFRALSPRRHLPVEQPKW